MILMPYINEWQQYAPWSRDTMVEQDLIISRVLIELFNHPAITKKLAFRGGTALYKLYVHPALRYSEDIDLVQVNPEPIGNVLDAIKSIVDPLLGEPKRNFKEGRVTLIYKLALINQIPGKLKIEINTREHFSVYGFCKKSFGIKSRWFTGETEILTYEFSELIGTKLRALYQRKKGRDLFDLWVALQQHAFNTQKSIDAFCSYMKYENKNITRAMYEQNLFEKMNSPLFNGDIKPLLPSSFNWDMQTAAVDVKEKIIALLPGEAWQGNNENK